MKDEIKEILDKIKKQLEADEGMGFEIAKDFHKTTLNYKEIKLLLDYITNLEQENEEIKNTIDFIDNKYKNTINYNEKLIEYNQDYKSRIDKAIEYIEEHIKYECDGTYSGMNFYSYHLYDNFKKEDLLNILTGGDEE